MGAAGIGTVNGAAARRSGGDRRLLGDLLLEAGLVSGEGLRAGLEAQRLGGGRLGWHLVRLGRVVPAGLHLYFGEHLEAIHPDLVRDLRSGTAAHRIPARLAHHYGMAPVREADGTLEMAMASADAPGLKPALEALTGVPVNPVICPPSLIGEALLAHYAEETEPGVLFRPWGDHVLLLGGGGAAAASEALRSLGAGAPAADWLRALTVEAIERGARGVEITPQADRTDVVFTAPEGRSAAPRLPAGPYAGVAALLDGLARISVRGRILPREGRFVVAGAGRRRVVSVLALPGLAGRSYALELRDERVVGPEPGDLASSVPGLAAAVERLAASARGLLVLAAPGRDEWTSALSAVLHLLGDRLPRRVLLGSWDEPPPESPALETAADLLILGSPWRAGTGDALLAAARDRIVLAAIDAPDAFRAAESLARAALGSPRLDAIRGIVAVRHLEALCRACRVPFDLGDLRPFLQEAAGAAGGGSWTAPGCSSCRRSGRLDLVRVGEFLPLGPGDLARPGIRGRTLRRERLDAGHPVVAGAALRAAGEGRIDIREVLRLLVHEPR